MLFDNLRISNISLKLQRRHVETPNNMQAAQQTTAKFSSQNVSENRPQQCIRTDYALHKTTKHYERK